jgi:hypothetical protein
MRTLATACVGMMIVWVAGCCNCIKPPVIDTRPLPPPISLDEQLQMLNRRASELPLLKAKAESGGVELLYTKDGKTHHDSCEGTLLLQQNYADHTANVKLAARALDQDVFVLGRNEQVQWRIDYDHPPHAWVWPAQGRMNLWEMPDASRADLNLLKADLIPLVLAITEIVPEPGANGGTISMRVDDLRGVNDLLISHRAADGSTVVEREILIDRRSGEVREVDLFGPGGVLLVHATLAGYVPVVLGDGAKSPDGVVPTMPRQIVIDQPATHFRVGLTLAGWQMPAKLSPAAFATPDWTEQGITPMQGE